MNHKLRARKLSLVRGEHTPIVGSISPSTGTGLASWVIGRNCRWAARSLQNSRDGFLRLLGQIGAAQNRTGAVRVVVGMEPSGHYWKALATFLREHGVTVVTVSAVHVKRAEEFDDNSPTKSDRNDKWVIARRVSDGDFFCPYLPEGICADLRVLTQARQEQRVKLNQALNQLHTILDEYFPELADVFVDPLGLAAHYILNHYPFPADIRAVPTEQLAQDLSKASNGRVGLKRARQLQAAATDSVGVKHGLVATRLRLRQRLADVAFCQAQLAETEAAMAEALQQTGLAAPYLLNVPGVGVVTAASLLGEVGDLRRYEDWRQLRKLAGYNLKENSSGDKKGRTQITKRGRPRLRSLLCQAALTLVAQNPPFL